MADFDSYNKLVEQGITPVLELSISNNSVKRPIVRNIGRALLPKRAENWFLGNQEEENLLNKITRKYEVTDEKYD